MSRNLRALEGILCGDCTIITVARYEASFSTHVPIRSRMGQLPIHHLVSIFLICKECLWPEQLFHLKAPRHKQPEIFGIIFGEKSRKVLHEEWTSAKMQFRFTLGELTQRLGNCESKLLWNRLMMSISTKTSSVVGNFPDRALLIVVFLQFQSKTDPRFWIHF